MRLKIAEHLWSHHNVPINDAIHFGYPGAAKMFKEGYASLAKLIVIHLLHEEEVGEGEII